MDPGPFFVICVIIFDFLIPGEAGGYHASCRDFNDCDASKFLECDVGLSKICICPTSPKMYYELDIQSCVSTVDEGCKLGEDSNLKCVNHAKCVPDKKKRRPAGWGVCSCLPGYEKAAYGFCEVPTTPGFQPYMHNSVGNLFSCWKLFSVISIPALALVGKYLDVF